MKDNVYLFYYIAWLDKMHEHCEFFGFFKEKNKFILLNEI